MDNAEPYDLLTVLLRLEGLKGMAHEIGRLSTDDARPCLISVGIRAGAVPVMRVSAQWTVYFFDVSARSS
jgi:hypothetical protein